MSNYVPIVNLPFLYINNMQLSNDGSNPDEIVNIAAGQCRDSSNTYDIVLSASVAVNNTLSGAGGLDTGSVAASKLYAVYIISDPVSGNPTVGIMSLNQTNPLMPFGYSAYRKIGYVRTDGTSDNLLGYWSGNNNARKFTYDAAIATSVTAGTSATYAAIDLSQLVPADDQLPVRFMIDWTANAAADVFNMQGANSTGDAWQVISAVAGGTAHTVAYGQVLSQLVSSVPKVNYKVSAVGGVAINVSEYDYYV